MPIEEGADRIVGQCLSVRKGEHVLIIADIERKTVGEAIFLSARRVEAVPVLAIIPPRERPAQEPPDPLAKLMLDCEVIVLATSASMTHTMARVRATKAGARIASLPGVTEESLSGGGIAADYEEIGRVLRMMERKLRNARKVHVTSGGGTDTMFSVKGREWITKDTGLATRRGQVTTLPAGEVFVAPVEETGEGRLVFDVRLHDLLVQPATLILTKGYATRAVGSKSAVAEMNRGGKEGRNLGKFGIGLNPRAKPRDRIVEAQKALGAVHIVIGGSAPFGGKVDCDVRVDGIMTEATVEIDGSVLMDRGRLPV